MTVAALPRLTEQIIRNSIAMNLQSHDARLALQWGVDEYFEDWGGSFLYEADGRLILHANSAFSEDEWRALQPLVDLLNEASAAAEGMRVEEFVGTAWPGRIEQSAQRVYAIMASRGRFSEEAEEQSPSLLFDA